MCPFFGLRFSHLAFPISFSFKSLMQISNEVENKLVKNITVKAEYCIFLEYDNGLFLFYSKISWYL